MIIYPILRPESQIAFYLRLKDLKSKYFHEALSQTIQKLDIGQVDRELSKFVKVRGLQKLASFSLRGESLFPIPILLMSNPYLLGYYRLLFGFSQKGFYNQGPFGGFTAMEEKGVISDRNIDLIEPLCYSLIETGQLLLDEIDDVSIKHLSELQLLTVGPMLKGSINNVIGQIATERVFNVIKEIVKNSISDSTDTAIKLINSSGREVLIQFSSDPDIVVMEILNSGPNGLLSIEIKGGMDKSNIHNRIGEAEKSHRKAKEFGFFEFITIINVDRDYSVLKIESPTTTNFFQLGKITERDSNEYEKFRDILLSRLGIKE